MTLKKGIVWSQWKMRPKNLRKPSGKFNPIMEQTLGNKRNDKTQTLSPTAQALNLEKEKKEFWGLVKSVSKEGVYKNELRKLFGDIRSGKIKTRTISKKR